MSKKKFRFHYGGIGVHKKTSIQTKNKWARNSGICDEGGGVGGGGDGPTPQMHDPTKPDAVMRPC